MSALNPSPPLSLSLSRYSHPRARKWFCNMTMQSPLPKTPGNAGAVKVIMNRERRKEKRNRKKKQNKKES